MLRPSGTSALVAALCAIASASIPGLPSGSRRELSERERARRAANEERWRARRAAAAEHNTTLLKAQRERGHAVDCVGTVGANMTLDLGAE